MPEIDPKIRAFLDRYLEDPRFIWTFQDNHPSPILSSSIAFGNQDFTITIIDSFAGRQPILLNRDTLNKDEVQIPFRPTAILDSNVVSSFVQLVFSKPPLPPNRHAIVLDFLKFLVQKKLDYNPFFYFMESYWKDPSPSFRSFAVDTARAMLTLHCMDTQRFLESDEIVMDPKSFKFFQEEYNESSFESVAEKHAIAMTIGPDWYPQFSKDLGYATLLKMAVIHKGSNKSIEEKFFELQKFMESTTKVAMGSERLLSLGYFAGRFDNFIPLQRGANPDRTLKRIRAASWDLLLLRLPAELLARTGTNGICLSYVCTVDKTLTEIAKGYALQMIVSGSTPNSGFFPILSYDYSFLKSYIANDTIEKVLEQDREWQRRRMLTYGELKHPISDDVRFKIIAGLENEVRQLCVM